MNVIRKSILQFLRDEDGPTAVEYAVMLALIIVVCIVSIRTLGNNTNTMYSSFNQNSGLGATGS